MKAILLSKTIPVLGVFCLGLGACKKTSTPPPPVDSTITGVVSSTPSFSLLKSAVVKANLATTLSGTGPFTVFAPPDSAFKASGITADVIGSLSAAELKTILLYHTIPAKITAAQVPSAPDFFFKPCDRRFFSES